MNSNKIPRKYLAALLLISLLLAACRGNSVAPRAIENPKPQSSSGAAQQKSAPSSSQPEASEAAQDSREEYSEPDPWSGEAPHPLEGREELLQGDVVEIGERLFLAQTNDVYLNPDDYYDKIIQYQGFYTVFTDPATGEEFRYIGRYGPGCCANDTIAGFEVRFAGEYPEINDWVEVTGQIQLLPEENVLIFQVQTLTVKAERGLDTVKF